MAGRSAQFERFMASTSIGYEQWHDGVGYDLDALRALTGSERSSAERFLLDRAGDDWRDLEGLLALGTQHTRAAVVDQLHRGKPEQRLWAARFLHADPALGADPAVAPEVEVATVAGLLSATFFGGLSIALDLANQVRTPAVIDALFRACLLRGEASVHAAALLAFIHGTAKEDFDWDRRTFFLQFADADPAARRKAFEQLCRECDTDPQRYLGAAGEVPRRR